MRLLKGLRLEGEMQPSFGLACLTEAQAVTWAYVLKRAWLLSWACILDEDVILDLHFKLGAALLVWATMISSE